MKFFTRHIVALKSSILSWNIRSIRILLLFFNLTTLSPFTYSAIPFYSHLSMRDGLPSNIIAAMTQDSYGFLWIATGSGLARYDGYHCKVFKRNESENSLPSNELNSIIADGDFIWVGSWAGLSKINVTTFEITRIDLGTAKTIRTLYKGKDDILWIGTASGLVKYHTRNDSMKTYTTGNSGLSHNMVRTIYQDSRDNLWVGTYDKLNKLSAGSDTFQTILLKGNYRPALNNHLILDIKPYSVHTDSVLWIGTETGLYALNTKNNSFKHYDQENESFSNEVIKGIYTSPDGRIWMGTDFGLNIFDPETHDTETYFHNPDLSYSIANNVIWQIFEDSGGVIWFVTSNGLSRINKFGNNFEFHEISRIIKDKIIGNQVKSIMVSHSGIYWLATQHGVIRYDPVSQTRQIFDTQNSSEHQLLIDNVFALMEDRYNQIWIGTASGINIWNETDKKMYAITANENNGLISNYVGKFSKTEDGQIWVSFWEGGLFKIQGDVRYPDSLKFIQVPSLNSGSEKHVAGNGYIWDVEFDELYRIDPQDLSKKHITSFSEASSKQMIYSIYFSQAGQLWAGTQNGLVKYDPETNSGAFYTIRSSSEATAVNSIIEDMDGNIWCTTNNSLLKLNVSTSQNELFPLEKNMPLKSFYYGCAERTASGNLLFGGDNGYIELTPKKIKPNLFQPPIYITSMEVNNKNVSQIDEIYPAGMIQSAISFLGHLDLSYAQRSVTFEFASMHFWQPEMNFFLYKLDGFDDEWNPATGTKNFAVYSNLPAGDYTFHVKGSNNYGVESEHEALLSFTIHPPLFLQPGFIIVYILVVIGIVFYALKTYSARVHLKNQLKIIKMEKAHAEELELTKERFFTNISHELRTPISLILPPIHELQKKVRFDAGSHELIRLAEKNANRLLKLVNQILDFNKMETDTLSIKMEKTEIVSFCHEIFTMFADQAKRNNIHYEFESKISKKIICIDIEKIETVLFNLLSNAFKFTPKHGSIAVITSFQTSLPDFNDGAFQVKVIDSGTGISTEDQKHIFERFYQSSDSKKQFSGNGIGLALAREYIKLHKGTIEVLSEPEKGSTFIVMLPAGNDLYRIPTQKNRKSHYITIHSPGENDTTLPQNTATNKPLILIVEDNKDMIQFIVSSLEGSYQFITAENGEEAMILAIKDKPDVIISDIMMPVMDGLSLSNKIKETVETRTISLILLTARSLPSQRIEGIRSGADVYITKPFDIDLLDAHIQQLLNRKKELTEYFTHELTVIPIDKSNNEDVKFLKRVMDIIEANISDPDFSVELISEQIGMSSTHLYRKLKTLTTHSAKNIIKKYRIKKASLLLRNQEGNISEIMYDVGFSSLSYFSKCFKAEFGITPKEFQQSNKPGSLDVEKEWSNWTN